jgi:hypothetical protein
MIATIRANALRPTRSKIIDDAGALLPGWLCGGRATSLGQRFLDAIRILESQTEMISAAIPDLRLIALATLGPQF